MIDRSVIEGSLEAASDNIGDPTMPVFSRLFELEPSFEDMFIMDTDGSVKGSMLQNCIDCMLAAIDDQNIPKLILEAAAMQHDGYGINDNQLILVFVAIRDVLQNTLKDSWTSIMTAEWNKLLSELEGLIMDSASAAGHPQVSPVDEHPNGRV